MYLAFTPMLGGELLEETRVFVVMFVFCVLSANCVLVLLILACFRNSLMLQPMCTHASLNRGQPQTGSFRSEDC